MGMVALAPWMTHASERMAQPNVQPPPVGQTKSSRHLATWDTTRCAEWDQEGSRA